MLKTEYVRDGKNQLLGTVTSGFDNGDSVARDRAGHILGHSSNQFNNTRDEQGRLVSRSISDIGMLFRR